MKYYKFTYIERIQISRYKQMHNIKTVILHNIWTVGGVTYGYKDRFNIVCLGSDDIKKIEPIAI